MYGPVRTVVWQGSAGNRCPYADLTRLTGRYTLIVTTFDFLFYLDRLSEDDVWFEHPFSRRILARFESIGRT